MTVIAWDGRTLAADRQCTNSCGAIRTVTKIEKFWWGEEGGDQIEVLTAITGDHEIGLELLAWFKDGGVPEEFPESARGDHATLVAISREFGVHVWTKGPQPMRFEDQQLAWGSGRDYAMAALLLGKSAKEAVDLACQLNAFCGGGVDVLELPSAPAEEVVH